MLTPIILGKSKDTIFENLPSLAILYNLTSCIVSIVCKRFLMRLCGTIDMDEIKVYGGILGVSLSSTLLRFFDTAATSRYTTGLKA